MQKREEQPSPVQTQSAAPQQSWVQDLIDKRYQPQTERLKRSPVGFNFKQNPFDPSSYYRALESTNSISKLATNVTQTEASNRFAKQQAADMAASQAAVAGINPTFTYNTSGASRKYGLKGVASDVAKAADYFGSKYGIKTIGGRGPGSVPNSDHPKGLALDYMVYKNRAQGTALANDVIKNYKAWNVKYVIWYHYIWQPGKGWHKYSGPSPHTDHVHVSFNS